MSTDPFARYDGPCDVRQEGHVMRLHCYLRPGEGPAAGYVDNRYDVLLYDIAGKRVTLCLPGGSNVAVEAGDTNLHTNEPIGWDIEQYDPRATGWGISPTEPHSFGVREWRLA